VPKQAIPTAIDAIGGPPSSAWPERALHGINSGSRQVCSHVEIPGDASVSMKAKNHIPRRSEIPLARFFFARRHLVPQTASGANVTLAAPDYCVAIDPAQPSVIAKPPAIDLTMRPARPVRSVPALIIPSLEPQITAIHPIVKFSPTSPFAASTFEFSNANRLGSDQIACPRIRVSNDKKSARVWERR